MDRVDQKLQAAVDSKVIAGAVLIAADREKTTYAKAFGKTGVHEGATQMEVDTMMWVASCTKLMTSVSVLQCVEKGLFTLDEPVGRLLPEYANPDILTGFDDGGSPILKKATKPLTLRCMLSHSSGFGYPGFNPLLTKYSEFQKSVPSPLTGNMADYNLPLLFEPGEGWEYGVGIDWAGRMVERATGSPRLGDYMAEHIWKPLGMTSTSFNTASRPDLAARMCGMTMRHTADGASMLVPVPDCPYPIESPADDCGGVGSLTCPPDYLKLLSSLLRKDGKLLKPESVKELMSPQLLDTKYLDAILAIPEAKALLAPEMPAGVQWNHALGGIMAPDGVPERAGKGTMWWGGMPNLHWFIDPDQGICGLYAGQLIPPGDAECAKLSAVFQKGLFASGSSPVSLQ